MSPYQPPTPADREWESRYRAVASRDRRFDGMFYTGVRSTGIYCRPSCPARTPNPANVSFHPTAAAAQAAGLRACRRCLPDATPGSPDWDLRADVAGRAMRLIADGMVERDGVVGLADRLGYSPRHLTRLLVAELGAGPLALARARRAQQARALLDATDWSMAEVAYAAGFASVRQFNDTLREVYDAAPTTLRSRHRSRRRHGEGTAKEAGTVRLAVRLPVRLPFDAAALWQFLAGHVTPGVDMVGRSGTNRWYDRSLRLPHGSGRVRIDLGDPAPRHRPSPSGALHVVPCELQLSDVRDLAAATERCRRLLDADCDPLAVAAGLGADPAMAELCVRHPGLRVPGHPDGEELALRTVLGQQVSVKAGNRLAGRLVALVGDPLPDALAGGEVTAVFPTARAAAALDPAQLPMPRARARALLALAQALALGEVRLDRSAERAETRQRLMALPGVGPWTADYIAMRALGDPDVFLGTDVAVRRALAALPGPQPVSPDHWRPWRSYAVMHLWASVTDPVTDPVTAAPAQPPQPADPARP